MSRLARITFLGTGTSHGVPMIGCDCATCHSDDPHDRRWRPSILIELADGLSAAKHRHHFLRVLNDLKANPQVKIVAPSQEWFDLGVELYETRPDKDWSLTDCISFAVMGKFGATDCVTADHHFEQAGFNVLLKST